MRYLALVAFAISVALSANARAQDDEDKAWAEPKPTKTKTKAAPAAAPAELPPTLEREDVQSNPLVTKAKTPDAHEDVAPPVEPKAQTEAPSRAPIYGRRSDWFIEPYGYARMDAIEDSTQSFEDGIQPNLIQRAGSYRGDHRRTIFTARDSRIGVFVGAPTYQGMKSHANIEFDFYGIVPSDARRHDSVVFGPLRLRHAFLKLETPVVDIIAGQYYDVFGWGSYYYPATVAYLGVPAQVYHRNPQFRLEKKIHLGLLEIMLAAAAVRPGQRDSGLPDGQAGLKISYEGWAGAAMPGFGRPTLSPISVGVSGIYRAFEVPAFRAEPGSEKETTYGFGWSAQAILPIVPLRRIEDRGNALTITVEYSKGTGIADMYTFMDGGSRFPLLPNPNLAAPAIIYPSNVDPGLVTFDRNLNLQTINWEALVAGLQYYLPIGQGRVWVAGIYSRIVSDNIKELTPAPSWGGIFTKMEYWDANLGIDITPAVVLGLSYQQVRQKFGDVSPDVPNFGTIAGQGMVSMPGSGGIAARARNDRAQLSMSFFF